MLRSVLLLTLICFIASAQGSRVKRIVGGEQAAIPQVIPGLQSSGVASKSGMSGKAAVTTTAKSPGAGKPGSSTESTAKTLGGSTDENSNLVFIYEEDREANILGMKEKDGYISFKGLPYAEPPINNNRFQRPIFKYLQGKIEAFDYGQPCIQPTPDNSGSLGNEDCLYLNIYTPSIYSRNASGLPVLFWIHGGGFIRGSGNQYAAKDLIKQNIIVVTMNYRLGTLGFLGSSEQEMSGNAGLFDVRAAFEWTRRYITYFGGNSKNIVTAGQGSGASLAMLLAQSDFTAGYIKGVLAMSGTGISSSAMDYAPGNTSKFISQGAHCAGLSPLKTVRCLQDCDVKSIFTIQKALEENRIGDDGFVAAVSKLLAAGPMVEGKNDGRFLPYFLTNSPLDALQDKKMAPVPLLMGTTKSETGGAVTGKFKEDVTKRLKVPEFLEKVLPARLFEFNIGIFGKGLLGKLMDKLFKTEKYLKLFTSTFAKGISDFQKVIETTTDALFNLPVATTSSLWDSAGGESYFYNFEHLTNENVKKSFLEGLALQTVNTTEKSASHGDDLLYLFEMQDLQGKPVTDAVLKNQKDLNVKAVFIGIIKEFMYSGKPSIPNSKDEWKPFSQDNTYAIISENPKIGKKFRQCQIALWGGFLDILLDPLCNFPEMGDIVKSLPIDLLKGGIFNNTSERLKNLVPDLGKITNIVQTPSLPVGIPLLGGKNKKATTASEVLNSATTPSTSTTAAKKSKLPLIGGIIG